MQPCATVTSGMAQLYSCVTIEIQLYVLSSRSDCVGIAGHLHGALHLALHASYSPIRASLQIQQGLNLMKFTVTRSTDVCMGAQRLNRSDLYDNNLRRSYKTGGIMAPLASYKCFSDTKIMSGIHTLLLQLQCKSIIIHCSRLCIVACYIICMEFLLIRVQYR